jgi:drug/metabolite transporter (DMT)-like permease
MPIPLALSSALAYSTDAVTGKLVLDNMPFPVFMFILSILYAMLGVVLWSCHWKSYCEYFAKANWRIIALAIVSILIGTILADYLMWKAIHTSKNHQVALTICLIHLTPVFALIIAVGFWKHPVTLQLVIGFSLAMVGYLLMISSVDPKLVSH